jgi:transposase
MKATPEDKRVGAIAAFQKLGTYQGTAAALGIHRHTAKKWIQRFQNSGSVAIAKKTGRKRALSASAAEKAHQLLLSNQYTGSDHVARELHKQGITAAKVHKTTVIRAAREVAKGKGTTIRALRGKPCKQLSPATMQKRLAFAQANKMRDWGRVLFTDRKKFLFCYPGVKVMPVTWVSKGGEREAAGPNHPMSLNVYCGVSRCGVTSFHIVAGTSKHQSQYNNQKGQPAKNITKQEYRDVLMKTLLPAGQRLLGGRGMEFWVLQQDNDPTHSVASTTIAEYNKAYNTSIQLLDKWPPNSPDLNIIENLWSYVEGKVRSRGCETFEDFKAAVKEELASVQKKVITNLYQSIPKRLATVIRKKGGKTGY